MKHIKTRRKLSAFLAGFFATAAIGVAAWHAPAAFADTAGCTTSRHVSSAQVCARVFEQGREHPFFRVWIASGQWQPFCDYRTRLQVYYPSGYVYTEYNSFRSGCSWGSAWQNHNIYWMPHNTVVCGTLWTNYRFGDNNADGRVCLRIDHANTDFAEAQ